MRYLIILLLSLNLNSQNFDWANQAKGAHNSATDIAIDTNGDVYVFGTFDGGTFDDIAGSISFGNNNETIFEEFDGLYIAKYSSTGDFIWAEPIYENTYAGKNAVSIALDSSNNVYIVGNYYGTLVFDKNGPLETNITDPNNTNTYDVFIAKYDQSGNFIWVKEIIGENLDKAQDMVIDDFDNIIITGFFGVNID
jgi:hypothetical protein